MTMRQMYPAVTNSPGTELAADITATDTEITVLSTSALPPAPNLLTIGSDETAETVRYTAIEGDVLTVERGFQGTAKAWSAGTKLARNFTAYDHDTFIENIAQGTIDEREDLTLQTGVQIVDSEQDTPFNFGSIDGRTEIREGDGIVNVTNPYAIATGDNLLPPFYEWDLNGYAEGRLSILSPYESVVVASGVSGQYEQISYSLPVLENTNFRIEHEGTTNRINIRFYDSSNILVGNVTNESGDSNFVTFTTPKSTAKITVLLYSTTAGTFTFKRPMLIVGTEAKPFKPQQRSMWAAECQLAANPLDGTNADVLFTGDDGLPYVLEKWEKVELDGSLPWNYQSYAIGFKRVNVDMTGFKNDPISCASKYDGASVTLYASGEWGNGPDRGRLLDGKFYLSISNTDSGWGDTYQPTADEIKAYFLGWRMTTQETWNTTHKPYNNSGTKGWSAIYGGVGTELGNTGVVQGSGVVSTPTAINPYGYTPYRLQYLKATPTVEPVRNYETGLTICERYNVVEVGSGIVIREKANPYQNQANKNVVINSTSPGQESSKVTHKVSEFLRVYKASFLDNTSWSFVSNDPDAYGKQRLFMTGGTNYDPTAIYHVTYTMLDPTLSAPITGMIAANLRGTVSDLVQRSGDVERRLSVVENQKEDRFARLEWITPTLLNGASHLRGGVRYAKDEGGVLYIVGEVAALTNEPIFILPLNYRIKIDMRIGVRTWGSSGTTIGTCLIKSNGEVRITAGGLEEISLGTIMYQAY